jgi:hypothetical protein
MTQKSCSTIVNIENYNDVDISSSNTFSNIQTILKNSADVIMKGIRNIRNIITFGRS